MDIGCSLNAVCVASWGFLKPSLVRIMLWWCWSKILDCWLGSLKVGWPVNRVRCYLENSPYKELSHKVVQKMEEHMLRRHTLASGEIARPAASRSRRYRRASMNPGLLGVGQTLMPHPPSCKEPKTAKSTSDSRDKINGGQECKSSEMVNSSSLMSLLRESNKFGRIVHCGSPEEDTFDDEVNTRPRNLSFGGSHNKWEVREYRSYSFSEAMARLRQRKAVTCMSGPITGRMQLYCFWDRCLKLPCNTLFLILSSLDPHWNESKAWPTFYKELLLDI